MTYKYVKKRSDKHDYPGLLKLEHRLEEIHERYLSHMPSSHVMAIVIADNDPEKVSISHYKYQDGKPVAYHAYDTVPLRPIFVLFKQTRTGEFEPQFQAIENMIRAVYHLRSYVTYV